MRRWITRICICLAMVGLAPGLAAAQVDEAARANALYGAGKRLDALPLYENLAKAHPKELLYAERLADCLGAKAAQLSNPAEVKAVRLRERERLLMITSSSRLSPSPRISSRPCSFPISCGTGA